jgi:hypothetical protein
MRFLNTIAWIGLAALVAPLIAHLLARRPARRQPFPTLRFVPASALNPVRADRLSDLGLLALRCAVIAAAVTALAQPVWRWRAPDRVVQPPLTRAIIVDASASMLRPASGSSTALDDARRLAAAIARESASARVAETPAPADAIASALAWLETQDGRKEIHVISDFQPGAVARSDVDRIPREIGARFVQISVSSSQVPESSTTGDLALLAGKTESLSAEAARQAAMTAVGPATGRINHAIALLFPGYEGREAILKASQPIDEPWMFDVLNAVVSDPIVVAALATNGQDARAVVTAVRQEESDRQRLVIELAVPAHAVAAAAVIAAINRTASAEVPRNEADPSVRSADELQAWQRDAPTQSASVPVPDDAPKGRYLWIVVLALLGVEQLVRRARRVPAPEAGHVRAA